MQLGGLRPPEPAADLATALQRAATAFGHRPALTVLGPDRRDEQGFASLAQWAAKGAHLFTLEAGLEPGDTLALHGPPTWLGVAVLLAAWWDGLAVELDGPQDVAVAHETIDPSASEVYAFGEAVDGSPTGASPHEPYAVAVQAFPDRPPPPAAAPSSLALVAGSSRLDHTDLLAAAQRWGDRGALGVPDDAPAEVWVPALAVRPLLTGAPSVLLRSGVERATATQERVAVWV